MANTVTPADVASFNQGSAGHEWMPQSEVMDTAGEVQLKHGGFIFLDSSGGALAVTMPSDMAVGSAYLFTAPAGGTNDATVTLPTGITWDGTHRVATFDALGETIIAVLVSATRMWVANIAGVTFS